MPAASKPIIFVIWQSLVVKSYRSFFYKLAEIGEAQIVLIAPDKFKELGSQVIQAAAFDNTANCRGEILHAWSPHTQIVWYRGLTKVLRKYSQQHGASRPIIVLNLAEPYSITSLLCWLQTRLALGKSAIFSTYALQNIFKEFGLILKMVQKFVFSRCRFILSLGSEQSEVLRRQGFSGEIVNFPLWFDSSRFRLTGDLGSKTEANTRKITVGFIGSLVAEKGVLDIFDALQRNSDPAQFGFKLLIAGRGALQNQVVQRCEELKERGVECEYLGPLSADEVPKFFERMDILMVPSRTAEHWKEQFGRVIIEAMACGCTVIGSNSGEIPHVIGQADYIFKEAQPADLLRVLLEVADRIRSQKDGFEYRKATAALAARYSDVELSRQFLSRIIAKLA
jgi:glycosyltransferase involved in cell wall biosynthesis